MFSWSGAGDGASTGCMRLGGGLSAKERTTGNGVQETGGWGDGVWTWYDGDAGHDTEPNVYSNGISSNKGVAMGSGY